jgi:hypothetical protein
MAASGDVDANISVTTTETPIFVYKELRTSASPGALPSTASPTAR